MNARVRLPTAAISSARESPFLRKKTSPHTPVLQLLLTILAGPVVAMAFASPGVFLDGVEPALTYFKSSNLGSSLFAMTGPALMIGGLGVGFWMVASLIQRRHPRTFVTAVPRFRWGLLAAGLLMVAPMATAAVLILARPGASPLLGSEPVYERLVYAGGTLILTLMAAFGEEVFFRGWLIQQTAAFSSRLWVILGVSSISFAALHLSGDPFQLALRLLSGLALAWTVLRLGGLEFAIGAHAARNAMIYWWDDLPDGQSSGITTVAIIFHLSVTVVTIAAAELVARFRRVRSV